LDAASLMAEAREAVLRGPDESRWFSEVLLEQYAAGLADKKGDISGALKLAAAACDEPWRGNINNYLRTTGTILAPFRPADVNSKAVETSAFIERLELTAQAAGRAKLANTERFFRAMGVFARSGASGNPNWHFEEPPPSEPWWTVEWLDWFFARIWSLVLDSGEKCAHGAESCEVELMRMRPIICYDGSPNRHLFAPGLGVSLWFLRTSPRKTDPWWEHALYFGVGTTFAEIEK